MKQAMLRGAACYMTSARLRRTSIAKAAPGAWCPPPGVRQGPRSVMRTPALALAVALLLPMFARANGRFPAAQHLVGGPPGASAQLAVRTTFGLVRSADQGRTWTFLCEDLLGLSNTSLWDAPILLTSAPSLLAGVPDGLVRLTDGCTSPRVTEVGRDFSADLTSTSDGALVLWVGSSGPAGNRVLASTDGGATFTPRGTARDGVLVETIEVSDARPQRVYATAAVLEPRGFVLLRSDDGARSLREIPLARNDLEGAYLAGLDPGDPDGVWLRAPLRGDGGAGGPTALLHSRDGGETFDEVARTVGPMLGFAVKPDGTVFYGGPDDGLWRGRPGAFTRVADVPLLCLRWHDGALYACANHLRTGWAVGRSLDDGGSFASLLRFDALRPPTSCAAGTLGAQVCPGRWSVIRATLVPDAGTSAPTRDAGVFTPPPPPSGGCAVGRGRGCASGVLLGALLGLVRRRRRRA